MHVAKDGTHFERGGGIVAAAECSSQHETVKEVLNGGLMVPES